MVRQHQIEEDDEDNSDSPLRLDRRNRNNFQNYAVIFTLLINLSGLVWAAAKWSSAIETLQSSSISLVASQEALKNKISGLESRVILLEYQVNVNKDKLQAHP